MVSAHLNVEASSADRVVSEVGWHRGSSDPSETVILPRKARRLIEWREFLAYRDLFHFLVQRDARVLYKQSVLRVAWAVIGPVFSMLVFTVVRAVDQGAE